MFIDTHCHLSDEKFLDKNQVIKDFVSANVDFVIDVGYDLNSSDSALNLARRYGNVFCALGIHPDSAQTVDDNALICLEKLLKEEKCVALGEIGLDYHYEGYDKNVQKKAFVSQMELAFSLGLPVSIHSRDCTEDMLKILKENKEKLANGFVMHCFAGSKETAKILFDLGAFISFAGTVTFKNAVNVQEVACYLPIERILTETDSPYLAPHPFRGKLNSPSLVPLVAEKIASLRQIETEILAEQVKKNAKEIFKKLR